MSAPTTILCLWELCENAGLDCDPMLLTREILPNVEELTTPHYCAMIDCNGDFASDAQLYRCMLFPCRGPLDHMYHKPNSSPMIKYHTPCLNTHYKQKHGVSKCLYCGKIQNLAGAVCYTCRLKWRELPVRTQLFKPTLGPSTSRAQTQTLLSFTP